MYARLLVVTVLVALGCAPETRETATPGDTATLDTARRDTARRDTAARSVDPAAARSEIERIRDQWRSAAQRDDAAAVANLYADDAVFVGTETPEVRGRRAIQESLTQQFPASNVTRIESRDLTVSGDLAYDYGEFTQEVTLPNAQRHTINGHYLVVLRRQGDGTWKIVRHVSTTPQQPARR